MKRVKLTTWGLTPLEIQLLAMKIDDLIKPDHLEITIRNSSPKGNRR